MMHADAIDFFYIFNLKMYTFKNPHISFATEEDRVSIKDLLNIAYRGEASKKGWTSEAELIAGDTRADDAMLQKLMEQQGSVFLKYTNDQHELAGCVNLQQHGEKIYLGMFSVSPHMQGAGIGKQILKAAEEYALHKKCNAIYMSVISLRKKLIKWYERSGYCDTGKRMPFVEDEITGRHLQPLEFMILEKSV